MFKAVPESERALRELRREMRVYSEFTTSMLARLDRRLAELEETAIRSPYADLPDLEEAA